MLQLSGTTFEGAHLPFLGAITAFSLQGGLDSPAVSARIILTPQKKLGELRELTLQKQGKPLWVGLVDSQKSSFSQAGRQLVLEGRTKGGLLLDNEALPATLWGANLSTVFHRYLAPYGFSLDQRVSHQTLPAFTVYKNTSLWDVFRRFSRRLYGISPYVQGNTVRVSPLEWREELLISNQGKGQPFTRLEEKFAPYEIISHIILRDEEGYYSTQVRNPRAAGLGIQRRRYHIPTSEFVDQPRLNAHQRLRQSQYNSRTWQVDLPALLPVTAGMGVSLQNETLQKRGLLVDQWECQLSQKGSRTRLILRDSTYW